MKQMKKGKENVYAKTKQAVPSPPRPPPPPLPLQRFKVRRENVAESVTKQEIARFWRRKRINEEEHLLAAIKAAARIRARNLSEEDYMKFEDSLRDDDDHDNGNTEKTDLTINNNSKESNTNNEVRIGIKDWWRKSKYAYLNQPAIGSSSSSIDAAAPKKRTSTYIPNCFTYNNNPVAFYSTSLGVF